MKSKAEEYKVAIAKIFAEKDALTSKKDWNLSKGKKRICMLWICQIYENVLIAHNKVLLIIKLSSK